MSKKVILKKDVRSYNDGVENIIESEHTVIIDGEQVYSGLVPMPLADLLSELNVNYETEFTYNAKN